MLSRVADRRSPLYALTAWVCIALQLAVFTASAWHAHGPHERPDPAHHADAHTPAHSDHPANSPRDPHDPDTCVVCTAILALGHAAPLPPLQFVALEQVAPADQPRAPRPRAIIARGRHLARGPPPGISVSHNSVV